MAGINKIPRGGVVTLTHSLAVYNSAVNCLLLNWSEFFVLKSPAAYKAKVAGACN